MKQFFKDYGFIVFQETWRMFWIILLVFFIHWLYHDQLHGVTPEEGWDHLRNSREAFDI